MEVRQLHPWVKDPVQARAIQERLRSLVNRSSPLGKVERVAGVDISVKGEVARAVVVVLSYPELSLLEVKVALKPIEFPYVPGLLAFRELPPVLEALKAVTSEPEVFLVDGHGLAHPRRFGIACHLGLLLDKPAIGCAKSVLVGRYEEPGPEVGDWTPLVADGETVGAALRTRIGVKPIFVSIGHKVNLPGAIEFTLSCCRGHRLPEPTRLADQWTKSTDTSPGEQLRMF